jgi:hypothetical protein
MKRLPFSSTRTPCQVLILTILSTKSGTLRSAIHGLVGYLRSATHTARGQFESSMRVA